MLARVTILCLGISFFPISSSLSGPAECKEHSTLGGSYFTGRSYKTWDTFVDLPPPDAFRRAFAFLVKEGWKMGQIDKDLGLISASQEAAFGEGKAAPLNVLVEPMGDKGSKLTVTFSMSGGLVAPGAGDYICKILDSVGSQ